ncbi:hypothetical protein Ahy_B06g080846 [Arachis hypogaea]|uniref:SWIM-type domain-containing protein n=1 Tax=Arachis hypogaea TaxID=3818 RepID=A0A444YJA3_ARAHY|nr:hypothetical protein Ahy_B06g080846 [Arachis hypogaea]
MLKQHRELSMFVHRIIENNEEAGIRPSKTYKSFVAAVSGHRELSFIEKDLITLSKNAFLADARSKTTYEYFGVVSFDTTYNTNRYNLVFGSFVGVNHHGSREQRKRKFDAANFYTVIPCATKSPTEAQFQHVYTHEKFRKVQAQFREKCQCLLFESRGILCRHSLSVLSFEQVDKVAPKYILERWSKNVKRRHTHIKSSQDEPPLEPRSKRFVDLVFWSHNICEFTSESEKLIGILHQAFDNVMAEM